MTPEEEEGLRETGRPIPQVFERGDKTPHSPLIIRFASELKSFDLINPEKRPDWLLIETAFSNFFIGATLRLFPDDNVSEDF